MTWICMDLTSTLIEAIKRDNMGKKERLKSIMKATKNKELIKAIEEKLRAKEVKK